LYEYEAEVLITEHFGTVYVLGVQDTRAKIKTYMPLRELMRGFFDKLKSVSQGYASLSYEDAGVREASVTKLSILISGDEEPSLSRVISSRIAEKESEKITMQLFGQMDPERGICCPKHSGYKDQVGTELR
jgi:GTP-binding protein LepA